jgi:ribonuclease BN (tRNA processing enzyme)
MLGSHGGQQLNATTGSNIRCGTSTLIDVGGYLMVIDCGVGSLHRMIEAGYDADRLKTVLVTHHHQDHAAELGNFAGFSWSSGRNGGSPNRRLDIWGPTGTRAYERGYKELAAISIADQEGPLGQVPTFEKYARWHDFALPKKPVRLFENSRVRVDAARVVHGELPAVAYRVRTSDVDVVFSGDRGARGESAFAEFAKGADAMFHEIIHRELVVDALRGQNADEGFIEHLVDDHCDPRAVGRAATKAGVETLVLYHLIPGNPGLTDDVWRGLVAPHFAGRILVAHDLAVI